MFIISWLQSPSAVIPQKNFLFILMSISMILGRENSWVHCLFIFSLSSIPRFT